MLSSLMLLEVACFNSAWFNCIPENAHNMCLRTIEIYYFYVTHTLSQGPPPRIQDVMYIQMEWNTIRLHYVSPLLIRKQAENT